MLNIGLLGCSSIARKAILPALVSNKHFDLKCVASRSVEKGKSYAAEFNCDYCSYDELLENEQIDAVYISLPNVLHYPWGKKALEQGMHLLLDKPFTVHYDEARELIDLAGERGLVAMEGLMYVFHPSFKKVSGLVKSGAIGKLRHIEGTFGIPHMAAENIRYNASVGGGAILDNLIYPLSLCLNITGRSPENYQFTIKHDEEYQVDARGFLLLNFGDIAANVNYGFGLSYQNTYSIWGSEGRIKVNRAFTMPRDFTGEIIIERNSNKEVLLVESADHFSLMLDSFAEKISGSENSGINEGNDILKRMRIISDLYIASKSSPYIK